MRPLLALAMLTMAASPAFAQSVTDVVVFRRAVAKAVPKAPAAPAAPAAPVATCTTLTRKMFMAGSIVGSAGNLADAQAVCNAYRTSNGKPGSCSWQNSTSYSGYRSIYWNPEVRADAHTNNDLWGSTCA